MTGVTCSIWPANSSSVCLLFKDPLENISHTTHVCTRTCTTIICFALVAVFFFFYRVWTYDAEEFWWRKGGYGGGITENGIGRQRSVSSLVYIDIILLVFHYMIWLLFPYQAFVMFLLFKCFLLTCFCYLFYDSFTFYIIDVTIIYRKRRSGSYFRLLAHICLWWTGKNSFSYNVCPYLLINPPWRDVCHYVHDYIV